MFKKHIAIGNLRCKAAGL